MLHERGFTRGSVIGLAAVAACALGACGSSSKPQSPATTAITSTSAAAASSTPATSTQASTTQASTTKAANVPAPPPATAKLTAPGAKLKLGQTAVVRYETVLNNGSDGPSYKLAVTIESITQGSLTDFKGISLTGVPKHSTPFYVKLRMTNLGPHPMKTGSDDPADSIGVVQSNGLDGDLILTGYFPPCPLADTPNPFATGQTFTTCETFMERGKATQVGYNGSESTIDNPILWSS